MSAEVSGSIANAITFRKRYGRNIVGLKIQKNTSNTTDQATVRDLMTDITTAWKTNKLVGAVQINAAYKLAYNEAAVGRQMSGFNLFVKECVALNNGSEYDGSLAIPASPNL